MGLKPSNYIIGVIVFIFFIVGGVTIMAEFRSFKPTFASDESFDSFNDTFNRYTELNQSISGIRSQYLNDEPQWGVLGAVGALAVTAYNTLRLIPTSFGFVDSMIMGISDTTSLHIPVFIPTLLILGIVVFLVFSIISALLNVDT